MEDVRTPPPDPSSPLACQIRIVGHLGGEWADWFEGVTVTLQDNGETLLSGQVADQAALHGLLKRVRDLGAPVLSIVCVKAGSAQAEVADIADIVADIEEAQRAHAEEEK